MKTAKSDQSTARHTRRFRRLLTVDEEDPLAGLANLFDVALVFVAALLIALVTQVPVHELLKRPSQNAEATAGQTTVVADDGAIPEQGEQLIRYRIGDRTSGGDGQRLGLAYQLSTGEVIYVPEGNGPSGRDSAARR
jgi:hypothetical protein